MDEDISQILIDTLLGTKRRIIANNGTYYYLYPTTLGKTYLTAPLVKLLELNEKRLHVNPTKELLRVAKEKADICCRIIAINTLDGKDALDLDILQKRTDDLGVTLDEEDITSLLILLLTDDSVTKILKHFNVDDELGDLHKAQDAKKDSTTLTFCGKTIYGSMIDPLAEKYGWTLDYILWGVSYNNIQLLLADSMKTVYLSEDERNSIGMYDKSKVLDGNDPEAWKRMESMDWYKRAKECGDIT